MTALPVADVTPSGNVALVAHVGEVWAEGQADGTHAVTERDVTIHLRQ